MIDHVFLELDVSDAAISTQLLASDEPKLTAELDSLDSDFGNFL